MAGEVIRKGKAIPDLTVSGQVRYPLKSGPSKVHGRGVFAAAALPGSRKLGEVGGCLKKLPEARRQVQGQSKIYLVELTARLALDCSKGNVFTYLNHSCQANCYLRVYRHSVEVYSLRPIRKGEELTVNYQVTPHKDGMKCRCGHASCKGVL